MVNMTPDVSCKYGAPLGRYGQHTPEFSGKLYLQYVPLDSGGYDRGGAYWGVGRRLYGYRDDEGEVSGFVRAENRKDAKAAVLKSYPEAKFYR